MPFVLLQQGRPQGCQGVQHGVGVAVAGDQARVAQNGCVVARGRGGDTGVPGGLGGGGAGGRGAQDAGAGDAEQGVQR
jgi:hypothetical protein